MKKALIAGAASLAVAAMPVVGVFATTSHTDTLEITIADSCNFAGISHADGVWGDAHKVSATLANNDQDQTIGSTTFGVICNNVKGWSVSATAGVLAGATSNTNIPALANHGTASGYSLNISGAAGGVTAGTTPSAGGVIATAGAATDATAAFKVTYTASISSSQAADTYTGTVSYVLTPAN
ncbi:MAG: hypothetical protein Q4B29_00705 [Candidatus Saccharibacteria bacterium]|nr:hypothetical protein [Candidatus Saccharibacteria bacterium]